MVPGRKHFVDELNDLFSKILIMGNEVLKAYKNLLVIFETNDLDIARDIIDEDKLINDIEISINVDGYLLIAKQCPVASDLRRIITALKIANELERIADYAVNISKYMIKTKNDNSIFLEGIATLTNQIISMLEDIITATKEENVGLALEVNARDEVLDELYNDELKKLIKIGKSSNDEEAEEAFRAVLVMKKIERAGDHITNIAENIVYLVNGKRVELN